MASPTKAELQAQLAKLERALAREKKRKGDPEELARARDAQAATAAILRVIRRSPSDVQPVFEAIADAAMRLFNAFSVIVVRYDGSQMQLAAARGARPGSVARVRALYPRSPGDETIVGRCILARKVVKHADAWRDQNAEVRKSARTRGYRSALAVPLLDGRAPIGAIAVSRTEAGAFARTDVELLRSFADQAVIAIANVRRFHQAKEALERQTTTAEILKVISSSPDDVQPVFDAVARSSMRLLGALSASVSIRAGDTLQLGAFTSTSKTGDQAVKGFFPLSLTDNRDTILAQSVLEAVPAQVGDAQSDRRGPRLREVARRRGFQSIIAVPMLSKGVAIGTVSVTRREAGGFSDHEIELLTTFADQAVIAIENVRLFNETREALERQTATAEVLRVISSSPTDVQPVFDMIGNLAGKLCAADMSAVSRFDGEKIQLVALQGVAKDGVELVRRAFPMYPGEETVIARAFHNRDVEHVADVMADPGYARKSAARAGGYRGCLGVPMIREGMVIGVIFVARVVPGTFADSQVALLRTFADQAVIAIENARLFNETREALERQTASAEVLQVISSSLADTQPVFEVILQSCERLFKGRHVGITLVGEDGLAHVGAYHGPAAETFRNMYPLPINRETGTGLAIIERRTLHYPDTEGGAEVPESIRRGAGITGLKSVVMTPLMGKDRPIGAMFVGREFAGAFSDNEIALIKTFADQAVIAIENARLFNETKEALERQTASAEILRVIASSPAQVEPVFEAIVTSAMRLFNAKSAVLLRRGESHFSVGAYAGPEVAHLPEQVREAPLDPDKNFPSRAIVRGEVVHIPDWAGDDIPEHEKIVGKAFGIRSGLIVPLLRNEVGIGALAVTRETAGVYGEKEIALLRSFADQAVIAIENVRLFNETREALERQTATAEVLRTISASPTDTQPVFDIIAERAATLCGASDSAVMRYDGTLVHLAAQYNMMPEAGEGLRRAFPCTVEHNSAGVRTIRTSQVVQIHDVRELPDYQLADVAEVGGRRRLLGVPLMRGGRAIGAVVVAHNEPGQFSDHQIGLVKTFADQAVIAIENVRLFNETKEALERQTATAEILKVISSSPTDVQPVLETIVESAVRLCDAVYSAVVTLDRGMLHLVAYRNWPAEGLALAQRMFPMPLESDHLSAIAAREKRVIHQVNLQDDPEVPVSSRELAKITGYRALLIVPMVREDQSQGVVVVARRDAFSKEQIALLRTFADQAVIAIENVRLFNETKEALERQTTTAEILKVIASSPSDVQPVFEAIAQSAARLFAPASVVLNYVEDDHIQLGAVAGSLPGISGENIRARLAEDYPTPFDPETSLAARAIQGGRVLEFGDVQAPEVKARLRRQAEDLGFRSAILVPLMREGKGIGSLGLGYVEPNVRLNDEQLALLQTFADQAVIAIENVRLFNETKEALERQTATAEILKVISSSPTDLQPVFDAIAENAMRLCGGDQGTLITFDGEMLRIGSLKSMTPEEAEATRSAYPAPPSRGMTSARAILTRAVVNVADVLEDPEYQVKDVARAAGWRSIVSVPMLREGNPIGTITVTRHEPERFSEVQIDLLQTFADQAVLAIENVRLFNETKESLERQTATAEILEVISRSQSDLQPVFDTIAGSAMRLCDADQGLVYSYDGVQLDIASLQSLSAEGEEVTRKIFPRPATRGFISGRAILARTAVQVPDIFEDPDYQITEAARVAGWRSVLAVPMLRAGTPIGAIAVVRRQPTAYAENQVALLRTFADQAVIAIENVRLFNETKEALEQQRASGEVLSVISNSIEDAQPVFEKIVESCERLFAGSKVGLNLVGPDGLVHAGAYGKFPGVDKLRTEGFPHPATAESATGAAILARDVIHYPDVLSGPDVPFYARRGAQAVGFRSFIMAPLLSEGRGLGAIFVGRETVGAFTEKEIALLKTFANQAVIAIQNARLFNETREALERQTATAEILQVISGSPSDVQPVFDTIVRRAVQLCDSLFANLFRYDGEQLHFVASHNVTWADMMRDTYPMPADQSQISGRVILEKSIVRMEDALNDPQYDRRFAEVGGWRRMLGVPMVREGKILGAIVVGWAQPGPIAANHELLLKTFADQAAIAIENVRLFNETKEALERQTATAEILEVISESPTDVQPVFDAIVQSCMRLFGGMQVALNMAHGDAIDRVAYSVAREMVDTTADVFPMPLNETSIAGRAMVRGELVHLEDLSEADWISEGPRSIFRRTGYRSALCTPMLREGKAIGAIIVFRQTTGRFKDEQIALLRTFADQAVIAIENVRLFKELKERTEALTKSVGQLTALGEVSQVLSSTLDVEKVLQTIASRAVQLTGLDGAAIYEYDEGRQIFTLRGGENIMPELVALYRSEPIRLGEGAVGRAAESRAPVQIADIVEQGYESRARDVLQRAGARALLAVPLLREGHILGAIAVIRNRPGPFAAEAINLLQTFATQSAIAIQNARLFREIEEKGRQLAEASQHKSQFLASMSHELRTPLNAILGFNEMILGEVYGEVPGDMKEPLEDIQTSGKHLLRLINNVLDLAKIEAGRMELALADYSVQDMVESVRTTLRPLAESKGLEFAVSVPNDIPLAHGDSGRLTQCLMNLAGNSLKFTKEGHVSISVEPSGETLAFRVTDTGIGIPPEKIDTLFTEFKQTDATIASEYGGTGLGLAITKQFIEMHGGRIWVESEPGKGSSFIFEIPLRAEAGAAA